MSSRWFDGLRSPLEVRGWAHQEPRTWLFHFAWPTNPLPMNGGRGQGWRRHARQASMVKNHAYQLITLAKLPELYRVTAQLTWWVPDYRVRDPDNLGDLEKRLFDAIVKAGVVVDDRPQFMDKPRGLIRHLSDADGLVTRPGFVLSVTQTTTDHHTTPTGRNHR
ncbi:hypothetical protein [Microbacterium rhizophilus]|uniref:hypothetical protein n=1 Tax=Microbacterium rhizophilus TaxID=3138934 RepID=UPI0031E7367C